MTKTKSIYTKEYREIISKIVHIRKKHGLTQVDIARMLNRSQSYISKIENCQIRIDLIQLKELTELLNINIQELLR